MVQPRAVQDGFSRLQTWDLSDPAALVGDSSGLAKSKSRNSPSPLFIHTAGRFGQNKKKNFEIARKWEKATKVERMKSLKTWVIKKKNLNGAIMKEL